MPPAPVWTRAEIWLCRPARPAGRGWAPGAASRGRSAGIVGHDQDPAPRARDARASPVATPGHVAAAVGQRDAIDGAVARPRSPTSLATTRPFPPATMLTRPSEGSWTGLMRRAGRSADLGRRRWRPCWPTRRRSAPGSRRQRPLQEGTRGGQTRIRTSSSWSSRSNDRRRRCHGALASTSRTSCCQRKVLLTVRPRRSRSRHVNATSADEGQAGDSQWRRKGIVSPGVRHHAAAAQLGEERSASGSVVAPTNDARPVAVASSPACQAPGARGGTISTDPP